MSVARRYPPEHVPVLTRGKHRSPRKGACFMEFASYLAGERWSDHPRCTHPLLAALARGVNDHTSDEGRRHLAPLIPSVIGLTSDDLRLDAHIALLCAQTALPVVAAEQQRVMAVGVLSCEQALADLGHAGPSGVDAAGRTAPQAMQWAQRFTAELAPSVKRFGRIAAPSIVSNAVRGIATACVPDPDGLLRRLLVDAIDECRLLMSPPAGATAQVDADSAAGPPAFS
jgi:hypothetical protein